MSVRSPKTGGKNRQNSVWGAVGDGTSKCGYGGYRPDFDVEMIAIERCIRPNFCAAHTSFVRLIYTIVHDRVYAKIAKKHFQGGC